MATLDSIDAHYYTKMLNSDETDDISSEIDNLEPNNSKILAEIANLEKIAKKARENGLLHIEKAANGALRTIIEEAKQADSMADPNRSFRKQKYRKWKESKGLPIDKD